MVTQCHELIIGQLVDAQVTADSGGLQGLGGAGAADVLPSATDALFGGASEAAGNVTAGLGGEIANAFSEAASSGIGEGVMSAAADIGGNMMGSVAEGGVEAVGSIASAASEGVVDLVTDGIGSLLDAIFN